MLGLALAALLAAAAPAAASDASATRTYVQADVKLVQYAAARIPIGEAALRRVLAQVRSECPAAAAGSPQDPESTQLSNELIGLMVTSAIRDALPQIRQFVRSTGGLRWSSGSLSASIRSYVSRLRTMASLSPPPVCADVRSWAAGGFHALPASTLSFAPRFMSSWVALGEQPSSLSRFEGGELRSLARLAEQREEQLTDFEARAVETWGEIMNTLQLSP